MIKFPYHDQLKVQRKAPKILLRNKHYYVCCQCKNIYMVEKGFSIFPGIYLKIQSTTAGRNEYRNFSHAFINNYKHLMDSCKWSTFFLTCEALREWFFLLFEKLAIIQKQT